MCVTETVLATYKLALITDVTHRVATWWTSKGTAG